MNIGHKVKNFLGKYMKLDNIGDDDNFFERQLVNSLFAVQLVAFLEKEFEITIENDELNLENFKSVNAIIQFVEGKLA